MEGHQLDSESDIINRQKKKHIRKRTCNRVLTDAITNELKRLSDLSACSVSEQYKCDHYPTNIADVCINNYRNCFSIHEYDIPRKIIVYVPKAKNDAMNEYLYDMFLSNRRDFFHVNSPSVGDNHKRALLLPQNSTRRNNMMRYRDDEWCSCSGIDITRSFIFAKMMYEKSQQLQNLANISEEFQDARDCNTSTISVDLSNLRKLSNPLPGYDGVIRLNQGNRKQEIGYKTNNHKPFIKFEWENSLKFRISIEKHRFNIVACKTNIFSREFLQALETFFSMYKTSPSYENNCNVPSLSVRNWHFHNINQGYSLGIMLRNINVNTLNMMTKLYFVLIRCSESVPMIEIVIKLKSGIFMVYDNHFYQEVINWNDPRQLLIKKSVSMAILEDAKHKRYIHMHNREIQLNFITHTRTKPQQSNSNIHRPRDYLFMAENKESRYKDDCYFNSGSLYTVTSDMSAIILPQRNGATLVLPPDEKAAESNRTQKTGGGSIINIIFVDSSNMYSSNFLHSKQWLTKLFTGSNNQTENPTPNPTEKMQIRNIKSILKFNTINESIFDRTSIQSHLESVTELYWKHVRSHSFYKVFLKSLGKSIANIFFSAVI